MSYNHKKSFLLLVVLYLISLFLLHLADHVWEYSNTQTKPRN